MDDASTYPNPAMQPPGLQFIKHRGEQEYPKQVWYIVLSGIAAGTLVNVVSILWTYYRVNFSPKKNHDSEAGDAPTKHRPAFRRIPAALVTLGRVVALRWRFVVGSEVGLSVLEAFMTAMYLVALIGHEFIHSNNLDPQFYANRASHLAAAQIPLLPVLSAKNNVIGWLTGIGHEKLNILHRCAARSILVLIWVHLWGRWHIGFVGVDDIEHFYWQQLGVTSGTAYTLAIVLSLGPVRRLGYEVFYFLHVLLVFIFLIVSYLHASNPGFGYYIWPAWVAWAFDRLLRTMRYVTLNFLLPLRRSPASPPTAPAPTQHATLTALTPTTLRLTLRRRIPFAWVPGQHVFLGLPLPRSAVGQSHPFTIASLPKRGVHEAVEGEEMVFIIRAREGMTRRLMDAALASPPHVQLPVFIDGPYGSPPDIAAYAVCVFVAGGTGVSYTLPRLVDLLQRVQDGTARARRILFIWAIREDAHFSWISSTLTAALASAPRAPSLSLSVLVFVTRSTGNGSTEKILADSTPGLDYKSNTPSTETLPLPSPRVQEKRADAGGSEEDNAEENAVAGPTAVKVETRRGRPDVQALLQEEISVAHGAVSVEVSGPRALIHSTRGALAHVSSVADVLRGVPAVFFHAEQYSL